MTRRVYLVEKIDLTEGYESSSKVFTTYLAAVNYLKTLVADTFIFDHIWNSSIDGDTYTIELEDMKMFSRMGKQVYEFPLEEYFNKNEYEVKDEESITQNILDFIDMAAEAGSAIIMIDFSNAGLWDSEAGEAGGAEDFLDMLCEAMEDWSYRNLFSYENRLAFGLTDETQEEYERRIKL